MNRSALICLLGFVSIQVFSSEPRVSHALMVGEVSDSSACIWSRGTDAGYMNARLSGSDGSVFYASVAVTAERDFTGKITFSKLKPDTGYDVAVVFSAAQMEPGWGTEQAQAEGSFHSAPARNQAAALKLVWGGDVGGQNVCRDAAEGYAVFRTVAELKPDLFIGLGDMIYADNPCRETGLWGNRQIAGPQQPATELSDFWAYWKYNREDAAFQNLVAHTAYYGVWDDHEVINDFGPASDRADRPPYTPGKPLMPIGLRAFLDYNPMPELMGAANRLYRTVRWGRHLEIIFLDARQYRDPNKGKDTPEKTMLGKTQLHWFKRVLKESDATWKIVVSSVPISVPTGFPTTNGRDGWANFDQDTGFENELSDILDFMADEKVRNTVWLTTDVHFATGFKYQPFEKMPEFTFYELICGPMNAGIYPNKSFDSTFRPTRLFFYGLPEREAPWTYPEARAYFNFGVINIGKDGTFMATINNIQGKIVYSLTLKPDGD